MCRRRNLLGLEVAAARVGSDGRPLQERVFSEMSSSPVSSIRALHSDERITERVSTKNRESLECPWAPLKCLAERSRYLHRHGATVAQRYFGAPFTTWGRAQRGCGGKWAVKHRTEHKIPKQWSHKNSKKLPNTRQMSSRHKPYTGLMFGFMRIAVSMWNFSSNPTVASWAAP